jgi:arginase family enzyme
MMGGIERYIRTYVFAGFGQSTLSIGKETNQLAHHHFNFPFGFGGNHSSTIPTTTERKALVVTVFLPTAIAQHSR